MSYMHSRSTEVQAHVQETENDDELTDLRFDVLPVDTLTTLEARRPRGLRPVCSLGGCGWVAMINAVAENDARSADAIIILTMSTSCTIAYIRMIVREKATRL